jgi:hypothetical protein
VSGKSANGKKKRRAIAVFFGFNPKNSPETFRKRFQVHLILKKIFVGFRAIYEGFFLGLN